VGHPLVLAGGYLAWSMILLFLLGVFYEFAYLAWLYYAAQARPVHAAAFSMLLGSMSLTGILNCAERPVLAVALVLGYGVGSYIAAEVKRHVRR
jgi:hypothetical protein